MKISEPVSKGRTNLITGDTAYSLCALIDDPGEFFGHKTVKQSLIQLASRGKEAWIPSDRT